MNIAEKKDTWARIGAGIDAAGDAEAFLTRLALLCAMEVPSLSRVDELIALAHAAGRAAAQDVRDMRTELANAW
jgi:hypothetical protein